jgi:hypothetical protein
MRVGTDKLNIKSQLNARDGFSLLFGARQKFVYLTTYDPWQCENGTWMGALGHLINDNRVNWKQCLKNCKKVLKYNLVYANWGTTVETSNANEILLI